MIAAPAAPPIETVLPASHNPNHVAAVRGESDQSRMSRATASATPGASVFNRRTLSPTETRSLGSLSVKVTDEQSALPVRLVLACPPWRSDERRAKRRSPRAPVLPLGGARQPRHPAKHPRRARIAKPNRDIANPANLSRQPIDSKKSRRSKESLAELVGARLHAAQRVGVHAPREAASWPSSSLSQFPHSATGSPVSGHA